MSYVPCAETLINENVTVTSFGDFDDDCLFIASPFYPGNIYDNSECVWSFVASDPDKVIQVEFLEWTLVSKITSICN